MYKLSLVRNNCTQMVPDWKSDIFTHNFENGMGLFRSWLGLSFQFMFLYKSQNLLFYVVWFGAQHEADWIVSISLFSAVTPYMF